MKNFMCRIISFQIAILLFPCVVNSAGGYLPHSGQSKCYTGEGTELIPCPQKGERYYGQDAQYNVSQRSYTKLDSQGIDLDSGAENWAMVRDNITGLIWVVKTNFDGVKNYIDLNDADNTYTWCSQDGVTGTCGPNNTHDLINNLNYSNFGGSTNWRMPTINELAGIVDYSKSRPVIDTFFFPNTTLGNYWSGTSNGATGYAWRISFNDGYNNCWDSKSVGMKVRAVRDE